MFFRKLYGDQAKFFEMELTPRMKHSRAGLVSMVNNGQNLHGSQVNIKTNGCDREYFNVSNLLYFKGLKAKPNCLSISYQLINYM